jgi:hypothetical protein
MKRVKFKMYILYIAVHIQQRTFVVICTLSESLTSTCFMDDTVKGVDYQCRVYTSPAVQPAATCLNNSVSPDGTLR